MKQLFLYIKMIDILNFLFLLSFNYLSKKALKF